MGIASTIPINTIAAATGAANVDHGNLKQTWNWNSLAGNHGLVLSSLSTAAASNDNVVLDVINSGANSNSTQTTVAAKFQNIHTGTGSTNIAGQFNASGGTNNFAIYTTGGVRLTGLYGLSNDTTAYKSVGMNSSGDLIGMDAWYGSGVGGSGETNTGSNLGGGLAIYSTKVGVDLRFNSFSSSDFNLGSNLFSLDATLKSNWNTAYSDRNKWDGGATGLTAATGRTSLGATTIGGNMFTSTNPSAITFGRANADNSFDWLSASNFRTAIGAVATFRNAMLGDTLLTNPSTDNYLVKSIIASAPLKTAITDTTITISSYNGSAALASNFTTSSTNAVSTNLTFAVLANEVYNVVVEGTASKATSSTGLKVAIDAPAAGQVHKP